MTSRELVLKTLEFKNDSGRVPRHLWYLPWADMYHHDELVKIIKDFPDDIQQGVQTSYEKLPTIGYGDLHEIGESVDEWNCKRVNLQRGVIGEVKEPAVQDEDWEDWENVHIPTEYLTFNPDEVNENCKKSDKFVIAGCCPNPFERLQYARGTEQLYMDLLIQPTKMFDFINAMHKFYCELMEKWAKTDVDGLLMMDDWGSQQSLLINPSLWREIFKPLYRDYINIAKKYGKKTFMHSDGYIMDILPDLIDLGLDAVNSQIFCMGLDKLEQFAGSITFWGEIDRQHMLPEGTKSEIEAAVRDVKKHLWKNGGCIAQCEFGPGGKPENVYHVFDTWNKV